MKSGEKYVSIALKAMLDYPMSDNDVKQSISILVVGYGFSHDRLLNLPSSIRRLFKRFDSSIERFFF